jgi:hypothetical protein
VWKIRPAPREKAAQAGWLYTLAKAKPELFSLFEIRVVD